MQDARYKAFISSRQLVTMYEQLQMDDRAKKVLACGKAYSFYVCHDCGEFCYLQEFRCDDRLCALCARARVSRLLESYGKALKDLKGARMVTVSMRSRPQGELKLAVKELWNAFTRLRHRKLWEQVRGSIVSLEITWNDTDRTWHPHLHILVDSGFIVWQGLRDAWHEVTLGEGKAVFIQKCKAGWERELIKYITKVGKLLKCPAAFREFLEFARGRRFIRTYGTLYNCAAEREETSSQVTCKGCGSIMHLEKSCVRVEEVFGMRGVGAYAKKRVQSSPSSFGGAGPHDILDPRLAQDGGFQGSLPAKKGAGCPGMAG